MEKPNIKTWLETRSVASQRVIRFGLFGFLAAVVITSVQFAIWARMGWGAANFLPLWALVPIYLSAVCVSAAVFYSTLGYSAWLERKLKWGTASLMAIVVTFWVAGALAHSLPQLSTLVLSSPVTEDLAIYDSRLALRESRRLRRNYCRTNVKFGPLYQFRGGWCGIYMSQNQTYGFVGHGNAVALRIDDFVR